MNLEIILPVEIMLMTDISYSVYILFLFGKNFQTFLKTFEIASPNKGCYLRRGKSPFYSTCHDADIMRDTRGLSFFMSENKKWFAS